MARRPAQVTPPAERFRWARFAFWLVSGGLLMVGTLFAWRSTESFLVKDNRFSITESEDFAGRSPDLIVEGIHYASTSQIRHVFSEDFGRSLYLVPLQERRGQLLAIDWVEDATVSKIWPDTLRVKIRERQPVAFVHLSSTGKSGLVHLALIDRDGHILRPRIAAQFTLPVITGIYETEPLDARRERVHRVLGMLKEVGPLAAQISEVDVSDLNNLIVAEHVGNSILNLMVGDDNYSERLQSFLSNYSEIKQKRPDAKTLDLRVDGVITAVGDDRHEQ